MPEAHLLIRVEGGAESRRAFGAIGADAKRASDAMGASFRAQAAASRKTYEEIVKAAITTAASRVAIERKFAYEKQRIDKEATQATANLLLLGVVREDNAAKEKERIYKRLAVSYLREEQNKTKVALAEDRKRLDSFRRTGSEIARGLGGAAYGIASNVHGQIQGVRATRAQSEHAMNAALYQAGASAGNAGELRARIYEFARRNGMDSGQLAAAMNTAQTEFSVLGNSRSSQATRSGNVDQFLQTALLARNTGQDVSEVARVAGLLQHAGITGGAQRQTLLGLTGMAQRGAIELRGVSREAMQPMTQRMHDAESRLRQRNPNATEAEIVDAKKGALLSSFAEIEVARGQGQSARRFANATSALTSELQGTNRQSKIRTNIEQARGITGEQRGQLLGMFDRGGALREQYTTGLGFSSRVNQVLGGNEAAMRNMFSGGGHGNPMSLQSNWRNAVSAMMSGGGEIQRMVSGVGQDFTETDVQRGAGVFGGEALAELNKNEEARATALGDNTSAINQLSNAFTTFTSANPIATQVAAAAGGALLPRLLGRGGAALAPAVGGVLGAGRLAISSTKAAGALAGLGIGGSIAAVGAAGLAGVGIGDMASRAMGSGKGLAKGNADSVFNPNTWAMIGRYITDAFRTAPLQVNVDPHAVTQVQAQAASGANPVPPEQRR